MVQTVKTLSSASYLPVYKAMKRYTALRDQFSRNAVWIVEHQPVFTYGPRVNIQDIPVAIRENAIKTDRGGEITWHGPGQVCVYVLLNIKQMGLTVRTTIEMMMQAAEKWLSMTGISKSLLVRDSSGGGDTGLYCGGGKIVSVGMCFRRNYCYHGISINVNNQVDAFANVEICGVYNRSMARVVDYVPDMTVFKISQIIQQEILSKGSLIFSPR